MTESNSVTGYKWAARPTVYRGVRMRSRLEAQFAQVLDKAQFEWEYEPECYADQTGQYLPDFKVSATPGQGVLPTPWFVEVKPFDVDLIVDGFDRMHIIRASHGDKAILTVCSLVPRFNEWKMMLSCPPIPLSALNGDVWDCAICRRDELLGH